MRIMHTAQRFWVSARALAACGMMAAATVRAAETGSYLGPGTLVASRDGSALYVANSDAGQVMLVDLHRGKVIHRIDVPAEPTGLALSPDGTRLFVTCASPQSTVGVIDPRRGELIATIPAGHTAMGPVVTPDGKRLYVCNRFDNDVSVIDLEAGREIARLAAAREPIAAAVTPDGRSVLVINHLPAGRADGYQVAAVVTLIDTRTHRLGAIRLPSGATDLRDICLSPDGRYAYVTHILAHYELPTTQVEYGWMNVNALSVIDTRESKLLNTVSLDDVKLGAANPWGVACSAEGKSICVAHAGTHELSVIDAPALLKKLLAPPARAEPGEVQDPRFYDDRTELLDYFRRRRAALGAGEDGYLEDPPDLYTAGTAAGVPDNLSFLAGLRRRVKLPGNGPRGLAVVGSKAYVAEYFSDSLAVVDLQSSPASPVSTIALGPKPQPTVQRRGEMLFHDATLCFQHWQSCGSCHPEARVDGLNWDLVNDGVGNSKNTRSMLLAHRTPPAMAAGVRPAAAAAVRAGLSHILFGVVGEEEAAVIDGYLKALRPVPSPHLENGRLSPAAVRGRSLFESNRTGCYQCHPAPLYTDLAAYNVATKRPWDHHASFDTPTLIEVWRTAPYLHDGRYRTVKELITRGKHGRQRGDIGKLNDRQIDELVEFVLSL